MSLEDKLNSNGTKLNPVVRTNSPNIPGGSYNIPKSGNKFGWYTPSGPLRDLDDKIVNATLNSYTESDTYLNQFIISNPLKSLKGKKKRKMKKKN
jgi:hypothetical protein